MFLHQGTGIAWVSFQVQHAVSVGIQHRVGAYFFHRRQADHRFVAGHTRAVEQLHNLRLVRVLHRSLVLFNGAGFGVLGIDVGVENFINLTWPINARGIDLEPVLRAVTADKRGAAHVGNFFNFLSIRQALRHFNNGPLSVAIEQNIGARIDQDRVAHFVLPIIVMRDTAQRRFDTAQHNRHIFIGFFAALAVHQAGAIRPLAGHAARGIRVVRADFFIGGVAVNHRVHVAGRHTEEQVRLAELHKVVFRLPVRLGNNAHAKALRLQ